MQCMQCCILFSYYYYFLFADLFSATCKQFNNNNKDTYRTFTELVSPKHIKMKKKETKKRTICTQQKITKTVERERERENYTAKIMINVQKSVLDIWYYEFFYVAHIFNCVRHVNSRTKI